MSEKPRFNFENTNISGTNTFGDNNQINVQTVGRDEFTAHLSKLRAAIVAESEFDDSTRNELLDHIEEAKLEAERDKPDASLIKKSLGFVQGVAIGALSKATAETALIPLIEQASQMAQHLIR